MEKKPAKDWDWIPLAGRIDFENHPIRTLLLVFAARFSLAVLLGQRTYHPDQIWQGQEMAYSFAYSDVAPVIKTWEWLDIYALRSVIWPAYLSLPLHILRFLGLDSNFLVSHSALFMNSLLQVLGDYFLY